jgi:hypothetical protein
MFEILKHITGLDFEDMGFHTFAIPESSTQGALYADSGVIALHPFQLVNITTLREALCNNETLQYVINWTTMKPVSKFKRLYNVLFPNNVVFTFQDYAVVNARRDFPTKFQPTYNTKILYLKFDTTSDIYRPCDITDVDPSTGSLLEVKSGCTVVDKIEIRAIKRTEATFHIENGKILVPQSITKPTLVRTTETIQSTDSILEVIVREVIPNKAKQSRRHVVQLRNGILDYDFYNLPNASWMSHFNNSLDFIRNPTNRVIWHMLNENETPLYDGLRLFVDSNKIHWVNYGGTWLPLQTDWTHVPDKDIQDEIQLYRSMPL